MTIRLHPDAHARERLIRTARGEAPPDSIVVGGGLVSVHTEEVLDGWGIAIAAGRVAHVAPDGHLRASVGAGTEVVELDGDLVSPGLVEAHTHITRAWLPEMARGQLRAGVTTSVVETSELTYATGELGLDALLAASAGLPARFLFALGGMAANDDFRDAELGGPERWARYYDHPAVIGLGEVFWNTALSGHPRVLGMIDAALERGLPVSGHGAGARPAVLAALAALGAGDDHEGIHAADELERMRLGLWTFLRHGATRQDLDAIAPLWEGRPDLSLARTAFITDGVEPDELAGGRSLNWVVGQAIARGLPQARAIRMASLNPAARYGLDRWLGALVPGALADYCVVGRGGFEVRSTTVSMGEGGGAPPLPPSLLDTLRRFDLEPGAFEHPGPGRWRAMRYDAPTVTREAETDGDGALPVVAVDRTGSRRSFRGLALGLGLSGGGVALSTSWESPSLLVAGDRPAAMAAAFERLHELRGGVVVCDAAGEVMAEWAAPIGGMYSESPLDRVASDFAGLNAALRALGCATPSPTLSLETLTTAAIPFLRITAGGYVRLKDSSRCGLEWDGA